MQPRLAEFLERHSIRGPSAYFLTAIAMLAATALRVALTPILGDSAPYAFQAIVLLISASFCGLGPGLAGIGIGLFAGWFVFPSFEQPLVQKLAHKAFVTSAGLIICAMTAALRNALLSVVAAQREADVLGLEMHHRVKNLFAVVASMVTLAARADPKASEAMIELRARLQALADAHDVAINPMDFVNLSKLAECLLAPHMHAGEAPRVHVLGAPVDLPPGYTTPMGLILNELATNAVKHGALATPQGKVCLSWTQTDNMLDLVWAETGASPRDAATDANPTGFGSLLVEASVAQLRGQMDRNMTRDGLVVHLSIPIGEETQNLFLSGLVKDNQSAWKQRSFLSALRGSRRFFRRRQRIRDSRS